MTHFFRSSMTIALMLPALFGCASAEAYSKTAPQPMNEDTALVAAGGEVRSSGRARDMSKRPMPVPHGATLGAEADFDADYGDTSDLEEEAAYAPEAPSAERVALADGAPAPATDVAAEPAPVEDSAQAPAAALARMKIYTGQLQLQVPDIVASEAALLALTEKTGGFMANKSGRAITVRVPVASFFEFVKAVKAMGQLLDEQFNVRDVTREAYELQLRIDTALKARTRLTELLSKAEKVEDILKIENEIRRLTEEIEVLKGSLRSLVDQASYSTLTVTFFPEGGGPAPQQARTQSPFYWINQSGPDRVWRMPTYDEAPGLFESEVVPVPAGYMPVGIGEGNLRALSAEEARFWARSWSVNGGDLAFWESALKKDFTQGRKLVITAAEDVTLKGKKGRALTIDTEVAGHPMRYFIAFFRGQSFLDGEQMIVVELLAPAETFEADVAAAKKAMR